MPELLARRGGPLLAALLVAALALPVPVMAATYQATTATNITAFDTCDGTPDTISRTVATLAGAGLAARGYTVGALASTSFTRSAFLARTPADLAVYVHSHGDHYWDRTGTARVDGFREDAGRCQQGIVYADEIAARRVGPARIVVMSTCHLGEAPLDGTRSMSASYGIAQLRSLPDGTGYRGPEFYLGYVGVAYTGDQLRFERAFWGYVEQGLALGDAFTLAVRTSGISAATHPTWFGSYTYYGWPAVSPGCSRCI